MTLRVDRAFGRIVAASQPALGPRPRPRLTKIAPTTKCDPSGLAKSTIPARLPANPPRQC
jgi:hypothetical protein